MVHDIAAIQLTQLTDGQPVEVAELPTLYRYPPGEHIWLRANMIGSLDGAATVSGLSGGLGGDGDRAVFAAMRATADVILVGAGTARAETYRGVHLSVAMRQQRQAAGQTEVPAIAVVTNSGAIDPGIPVFSESEVPPLVVTSAAGAGTADDRLPGVAVVVAGSGATVDLAAALDALARRNMSRVLCEGGPSLLGSLLQDGLVDEMCLTTAPTTVAGHGPRIATSTRETPTSWRRVMLLGDTDGYLFSRHVRAS